MLILAALWKDVGLPFSLSLAASILTVALLWMRDHWRMRADSKRYRGKWDQFVFSTAVPRELVRDSEDCVVEIKPTHWWRPDILHWRAEHAPKPAPQAVRVWEGDLVIDRNVHTKATIAWAYTSPPGITEFGAYDVLLHDNGDLLVTPALPPMTGDYLRFALRPQRPKRS